MIFLRTGRSYVKRITNTCQTQGVKTPTCSSDDGFVTITFKQLNFASNALKTDKGDMKSTKKKCRSIQEINLSTSEDHKKKIGRAIHDMFLIFQTSKRYNFDSVWVCVSHAATCHDNHQVGFAQRHLLFFLIMHLNESLNFQNMFGSFFYFTAAKFALYQSIASVVKMKHQVGFQSVAIAII